MNQKLFARLTAAVLLFLLPGAWTLQAQPTPPSLMVAIEPCPVVYGTRVEADVPLHLTVRGYCGVPMEAVAVFLNMKAGGATVSGKVYLWPYSGSFPTVSQFNFDPNHTPGWPSSGQALVRLRPASSPYAMDLTAQSTTVVNFSAIVEGYLVPLP